jgi:hypothetical protein
MQVQIRAAANRRRALSLTPTLSEGIRRLGLENNPAIRSLFEGTMADYIQTPRGREQISRTLTDPGEFKRFMQVLGIKGAVEQLINFLKTDAGLDLFSSICSDENGAALLRRIAQTREGKLLAAKVFFKNPILAIKLMQKYQGNGQIEFSSAAPGI